MTGAGTTLLRGYHEHTRGALTGFLMGAPLALAYALGLLLHGDISSHADAFLKLQIKLLGEFGYVAMQIGLTLTFISLIFVLRRRGRFQPRFYGPLICEAMLYAGLISLLSWTVARAFGARPLLPPSAPGVVPLVASAGEAVNQETIFRWILIEAIRFAGARWYGGAQWTVTIFGLLVSTAVYAVVGAVSTALFTEHPPPAFDLYLTLLTTGLAFGTVYCLRGYPAAAYAHTFYATIWRTGT